MRSTPVRLIATLASALLGIAVGLYIVANQTAFQAPEWLPLLGEDRYVVEAELSTAQAVMPGQGQAVTIAGVRVGLITRVRLRDGVAVARLELDPEHAPLHRDARLTLRPRTPLKDMFLALDPGSDAAPEIPDGGTIPVAQTTPDVNLDEVLASLDGDARAYLRLLLRAAGTTFSSDGGRPRPADVAALRGTLRQLEPLARDTRAVTAELARRRGALRRSVTNLRRVAAEVARVDTELSRLVDTSAATFATFAEHDGDVQAFLTALPPALRETERTLRGVTGLGTQLRAAATGLRPFARALEPGLRATAPVLGSTLPVLERQLRPFARDVQPVVRTLRPATADLAQITPALGRAVAVIQRLFDASAYNPAGREEGYLFWGAWLAHLLPALVRDQDAHGPVVRTLPLVTCPQLDAIRQVEAGNETLRAAIRLLRLPDRNVLCPAAPVVGGAR